MSLAAMISSGLCGFVDYARDDTGLVHPIDGPCSEPQVYEVELPFGDEGRWYGFCPRHTAWMRTNWPTITGVRQVQR